MGARGDDERETRAMFEYAAGLNDRNWRFFRDYGLWLGRIGDMAAATARFETAEALDPADDPALLMMLSMAHLRQQHVAKARSYFDRAVTAGHPTDLDFVRAHEKALMDAERGD
jgi:Flp pilus assembly protein TadD